MQCHESQQLEEDGWSAQVHRSSGGCVGCMSCHFTGSERATFRAGFGRGATSIAALRYDECKRAKRAPAGRHESVRHDSTAVVLCQAGACWLSLAA